MKILHWTLGRGELWEMPLLLERHLWGILRLPKGFLKSLQWRPLNLRISRVWTPEHRLKVSSKFEIENKHFLIESTAKRMQKANGEIELNFELNFELKQRSGPVYLASPAGESVTTLV